MHRLLPSFGYSYPCLRQFPQYLGKPVSVGGSKAIISQALWQNGKNASAPLAQPLLPRICDARAGPRASRLHEFRPSAAETGAWLDRSRPLNPASISDYTPFFGGNAAMRSNHAGPPPAARYRSLRRFRVIRISRVQGASIEAKFLYSDGDGDAPLG